MQEVSIFNKYDKVQQLHSERTEWTLRVRAQAVWKGINRQTQEFRGLNVIFIDDSVPALILISLLNVLGLCSVIHL